MVVLTAGSRSTCSTCREPPTSGSDEAIAESKAVTTSPGRQSSNRLCCSALQGASSMCLLRHNRNRDRRRNCEESRNVAPSLQECRSPRSQLARNSRNIPPHQPLARWHTFRSSARCSFTKWTKAKFGFRLRGGSHEVRLDNSRRLRRGGRVRGMQSGRSACPECVARYGRTPLGASEQRPRHYQRHGRG